MEAVPSDALRPQSWDEYVGQQPMKDALDVYINDARREDAPLGHVFLFGPAGVGKTSLGQIIASRLGDDFTSVRMAPGLTSKDLYRLFQRLEPGVLLLDELHRASTSALEDLLPVLEDGYFEYKGRRVATDFITVIGATTNRKKVIKPLRDRFFYSPEWDPYSDEEMGRIVAGMAAKSGLDLTEDEALALGRATAGIPRYAKRLVLTFKALAGAGERPTCQQVFELCRVDEDGLTQSHLAVLRCLDSVGGAAGLDTLCSHLQTDVDEIRELELLLVKRHLISYDSRGRELLDGGYRKLKGSTGSTVARRRIERVAV